jgi:hypothetical protein
VPGVPGGESTGTDESGGGGSSQPTWETAPGGGGAAGGETAESGAPGDGSQTPGGAGAEGQDGDESWESGVPGGDGGWETSNQLPGATSSIPPMPSEQGQPPGGGSDGSTGTSGGDAELDKALKDFDGGILAEREVIKARANETAASSGGGAGLPGGSPEENSAGGDASEDSGGTQTEGGPMGYPGAGPRAHSAPPGPTAQSSVPDDIPDAKDDDVVARQLREAAMAETDPELKEKLWDEYRRYKSR